MLVFLVLSFAAWASVDSGYYNLHQATGFYEQYLGGNCPTGKRKALSFLKSIEHQRLNTEISSKIVSLRERIETGANVVDIEALRLSIHEIQERLHLKHAQIWHEQVVDDCRSTRHT